jgi:hypothetical protein
MFFMHWAEKCNDQAEITIIQTKLVSAEAQSL